MSQSDQFSVSVASRWSARVAAVVLSCAVGGTAWAQAADPQARLKESASNPALADTLAALGRKAAAVCANCHGEGGTSVQANVPNLAAQNPAYLLDQMSQFADGRRKNEFMQGMIKAMKVDERAGVAMYYAAQKLTLPAPATSPLVEQGKALYRRNCFR